MAQVKSKMLNWAAQFSIFCFLDNQQYAMAPHQYECLLAVGAAECIHSGTDDLTRLDRLMNENAWWFGHLSYELKAALFGEPSVKKDPIGFPHFYFFKPQILLQIKEDGLHIEAENAAAVYSDITATEITSATNTFEKVSIQQRLTQQQYLHIIHQLQQHIQRGDCYEINFCQEFFAEDADIDPVAVYQKLVRLSPNPFCALYRLQNQYLICASPERFLTKNGNRVVSQPIKGTAQRGADAATDELFKNRLLASPKEQAENVMIVDLVRNDLSKICKEGSVQVDELFGIYSFPHVHQMISTISGELQQTAGFADIIKATFPMGSMTGAPKHRVLQLIDAYEPVARGIFSGSVGYIAPNGNFDFNVVIRSIMYNAATRYLSYQVGSGITFYSQAAMEWEECLLKGAAIKKVLTG